MKKVKITPFQKTLEGNGIELDRRSIEILQVNMGKLCNQVCRHCHVDAGPKRTEIMKRETVERILDLLSTSPGIHTVDITGGAPELNTHFRYFAHEIHRLGKEIIDRCNLTVLFEKGQEDTAQFLREHCIQIVASLPCFSEKPVDKQRGNGVFHKCISALKLLNGLGYGKDGTGAKLHLVYNPSGAFLPPNQSKLEAEYKRELKTLFGIEFNSLYTITNMPIKRFRQSLEHRDKLIEYMNLLLHSFNTQAAIGVMCRNLVSISWDGQLYDCDFNQMCEIPIGGRSQTIWDIKSLEELSSAKIAFSDHCYGCTGGTGSSCGGSIL